MPYWFYYLFCRDIHCNHATMAVLPVVYAQSGGFATAYIDLPNVILTILAILVILIFAGSLYSFVAGIFLLIFSRGATETIDKAFKSFRYALLGILLTLFLLFVFPFVLGKIWITQYTYFTADKVFQRASQLIRGLFTAPFAPFQGTSVPTTTPASDLPTEL